jgi:hypothetical protein
MAKPKEKWTSEAAMLTAFCDVVSRMGFRCVPEAGGHDLLLVVGETLSPDGYIRPPECLEPGDVVAVEGKLGCSITLLRQCIPPHRWRHEGAGADFYACVVPSYDSDFMEVADALDVAVWTMAPQPTEAWRRAHHRGLGCFDLRHGQRCFPKSRVEVPFLDVVITPGQPSPRALTPWKVAAVQLCLLGMTRDLTPEDFRPTPVRPRTFLDRSWMTVATTQGRSTATWKLLDRFSRPDVVYPEIVAAIEAQATGVAPVVFTLQTSE